MRSTRARPICLFDRGRTRKLPKFQKMKVFVVNCDMTKFVFLAVKRHQEKQ